MTLLELLQALVRRWPVVLVGALVTAAVGALSIGQQGVYWTRTEVVLFAPSSQLYPNALETSSADLVVTAGIVAKKVSGPGSVSKYADPSVSLIGLGVDRGWSIRVPDTGGQWATNFTSQVLTIEVVDPDRDSVQAQVQVLVAKLGDELARLQREAGVDPVNDITVSQAPSTSVIYHVRGNRVRALGMTALLGAGLTLAAVVALECRSRRRWASPSEPTDEVVEDDAALPADGESEKHLQLTASSS